VAIGILVGPKEALRSQRGATGLLTLWWWYFQNDILTLNKTKRKKLSKNYFKS